MTKAISNIEILAKIIINGKEKITFAIKRHDKKLDFVPAGNSWYFKYSSGVVKVVISIFFGGIKTSSESFLNCTFLNCVCTNWVISSSTPSALYFFTQ